MSHWIAIAIPLEKLDRVCPCVFRIQYLCVVYHKHPDMVTFFPNITVYPGAVTVCGLKYKLKQRTVCASIATMEEKKPNKALERSLVTEASTTHNCILYPT